MAAPKHFLDLDQFDEKTLREQLDLGVAFKTGAAENPRPLEGKCLAMIFEKASTRTRVSFDVGMRQLGGETIVLAGGGSVELTLGTHAIADQLRGLGLPKAALMSTWTEHMTGRFEEPQKV